MQCIVGRLMALCDPVPLSVSDPPSVSIEGYDNNWYVGRSDVVLICLVSANPAPTNITWTA